MKKEPALAVLVFQRMEEIILQKEAELERAQAAAAAAAASRDALVEEQLAKLRRANPSA